MIRTIIFDLGGVVVNIDNDEPKRRFFELGVKDIDQQLDPYRQSGVFGDLEEGKITEEEYRSHLSAICGRPVSFEEAQYCWLGYMKEVPLYKLQALLKLKSEGYRVVLLSNTNPYIFAWAMSDKFPGGHPLSYYFDALYASFEMKIMKPDSQFFRTVLAREEVLPQEALFIDDSPQNVASASQLGIRTYCPENGFDWTTEIYKYLDK